MVYLIKASSIQSSPSNDPLVNKVTVTGKLLGNRTEEQEELLLENALAFNEAVSSGLLDEETVKQLKGK